MAYFPHAYQKLLVAKALAGAGTPSSALGIGELALLNAKDYISLAAPAAGINQYILAQGSLHDVDKLGPFHGGYKESVKSKGINPRYVSDIWVSRASSEVTSQVLVKAAGDCFTCGVERYLRLDVKGSPALRFLGRNAYFVADWTEKCCVEGQTSVDPFVVLSAWADQINGDPFVTATVEKWDVGTSAWVSAAGHSVTTSGHGEFRIVIDAKATSAVSTHFGDAGFRPTDHYELEPSQLYASEVDETGDACNVICTSIARTDGVQSRGSGESVIRQLILTNRYAQDPFQQDSRMREILDETAFKVDRTAQYDMFYVLHSVPRKSNPSGTMDNDQYLISIAVDVAHGWTNQLEAMLLELGKLAEIYDAGAAALKEL